MITFEQIAKANEQIKTTDIKGKNYAEVNQRIKAFRMVFPNGSITTDIIGLEDGVVTMKATVRDDEGTIIGSGLAQEKETSSFINKTSFIENCETSAVGRALGMCGFGIDTSIASYEEVANAIENQNKSESPSKVHIDALISTANIKGVAIEKILKKYGLKAIEDISMEQYTDCAKGLNKMPDVNKSDIYEGVN
jgi:phosphoribosylformylglycinamidine (FGAM) synthase PurS component